VYIHHTNRSTAEAALQLISHRVTACHYTGDLQENEQR
jgi:hypothetical protein